jgi:hypothetical protein
VNLTEWKTRASQFDRQYRELLSVKSINATSSIPNTSRSKPAQTAIPTTRSTSGAPVKQEPSPGPSLASTTRVPKGACFKCGKLGHWANECPMPDQPGNPPPYQSASGSTITRGRGWKRRGPRGGRGGRTVGVIESVADGESSEKTPRVPESGEPSDFQKTGVVNWSEERKAKLAKDLRQQGF